MLSRFRKATRSFVEFCERCGSVCTSACRAALRRENARDRGLRHRGRPF